MSKISPKQYAKALVNAYEEAAENDREDVVKHFFTLAKKNRDGKKLVRIAENVQKLGYQRSQTVLVEVTTACSLSPDIKDTLIKSLASSFNKNVELEESVDQSLVGGVRIRVEDILVDGTVRHSLDKLQRTF